MIVLTNRDDKWLTEMAEAIREEQKRRFKATWGGFPKLEGLVDCSVADAVKTYRDTYKVSLTKAYWLFRRDYRS